MGTAVLSARRGVSVTAWTVLPAAVALAIGVVYLALEPRPGDLAAHAFRAELFGRVIARVVEHGRRCDDG